MPLAVPDMTMAACKERLRRVLRGLGRVAVWLCGLFFANVSVVVLSLAVSLILGEDVGVSDSQTPPELTEQHPGHLFHRISAGMRVLALLPYLLAATASGLLPEGQITEDGFRFLAFCSAAAVCSSAGATGKATLDTVRSFDETDVDGASTAGVASLFEAGDSMRIGSDLALLALAALAFQRPRLFVWLHVVVAAYIIVLLLVGENPISEYPTGCVAYLVAAMCVAWGGTQPLREERAPSPQETAPKRRQQFADDELPQGPCCAIHGGVLPGGTVLNEGIVPLQVRPAAQRAEEAAAPAGASWLHEGVLPDGGALQGGALALAPLPEWGCVTVRLPQETGEGAEGEPGLLGFQWRGDGVLMGVSAGSPAASCGAQQFIGRRLARIGGHRVPLDTVEHSVGAAAAAAAGTGDRAVVLTFAPLRGPGLMLPQGWLQGADDADRQCRICLGGPESGALIAPCLCIGSIKWVHSSCLDAWRERGQFYQNLTHCGQCKWRYRTGVDPGVSLTACGARALIKHLPFVGFLIIVMGSFDLWGWMGYNLAEIGPQPPQLPGGAGGVDPRFWDRLALWLSWDYILFHLQMGVLNFFSMLGVASLFTALHYLVSNGLWIRFGGWGGGRNETPSLGIVLLLVFFGAIYSVFLLWKASRDLYNREKSMARRYPVLELDDAEREQLRGAAERGWAAVHGSGGTH